jgi:preprotein translocase subunit SecA
MGWWRLDPWPDFAARLRRAQQDTDRLSPRESAARLTALRAARREGAAIDIIAPEAFALLSLAWREVAGLTPHEVQLRAGFALCGRTIVEMETGEGKSLTATFPLAVHGLSGRGAWLVTANDYLARRDADTARAVLSRLGLSVGCVLAGQSPEERRAAYGCDITYGTSREFGFDFLRDRLRLLEAGVADDAADAFYEAEPGQRVQRSPCHVVVDEADHVLIDEARTPLILSGPSEGRTDERLVAYRWAAEHAGLFRVEEHFILADPKTGRGAWLTPAGRELVRRLPMPRGLRSLRMPELYEFLERAIRVSREYACDREYIVDEDRKVVIIDEGTGRPSPGRQWAEGIHQAVEAREAVELSPETETLARVTLQEFFGRFRGLSGMTGTARSAAHEFRRVYRLQTLTIPTRLPSRRIVAPPRVFAHSDAKWRAVVETVIEAHTAKRPVLVGTRRVEDSQRLSDLLTTRGVPHTVLNATQMADEATIIAAAGNPGRVTIATNMAGRGTDIRLGEGVADMGGLLVLATEMHESERIDRQLAGRCGRQGDPGEVRSFLALTDEIVATAWGVARHRHWQARATEAADPDTGELAPVDRWLSLLTRARASVERQHSRERIRLVERDKARREAARNLGRSIYQE